MTTCAKPGFARHRSSPCSARWFLAVPDPPVGAAPQDVRIADRRRGCASQAALSFTRTSRVDRYATPALCPQSWRVLVGGGPTVARSSRTRCSDARGETGRATRLSTPRARPGPSGDRGASHAPRPRVPGHAGGSIARPNVTGRSGGAIGRGIGCRDVALPTRQRNTESIPTPTQLGALTACRSVQWQRRQKVSTILR